MTDQPERAPLEAAEVEAQRIAATIVDMAPPGWRFILWLVTTGDQGFSTHVSNVARNDAFRFVTEWLERARVTGIGGDDTKESCWCCGTTKGLVIIKGSLRSVLVCVRCFSRPEVHI